MCTLIFWIAIYQLHGIGRKSLMLLNFKQQLFSSSPLCIHVRHTWFHKLANHVKELFPWHWKLTQTFFEYFLVFFLGVLVRCFWDFVHVNLLLLCLEFCKKFWSFYFRQMLWLIEQVQYIFPTVCTLAFFFVNVFFYGVI